ncbi:hypothetical protein [Gemmata sp.]|uniref:hypothetical protein n=1 Tax=Gemmata sp. TaxID=1914242 RepID=UPI003F715A7B
MNPHRLPWSALAARFRAAPPRTAAPRVARAPRAAGGHPGRRPLSQLFAPAPAETPAPAPGPTASAVA